MNARNMIERQHTESRARTKWGISGADCTLSCAIAALMVLQSAAGLFVRDLYRESATQAAGWTGNDWVTLTIAVPLLLVSSVLAVHGSLRARFVWLGVIYYELYNNMYYLFGTPFNRIFLIYEALCILSSVTLIRGLLSLPATDISNEITPAAPRKAASGFMFVPVVTLSVLWVVETGSAMASGTVPKMAIDNGWMTHLPAVFDLSMIVTPFLIGAVWLWQSRPWGYAVSSIVLVQGGLYTIVLAATAPFLAAAGVAGAWDQVPLWGALGIGCIVFAALLLVHLKEGAATTVHQ